MKIVNLGGRVADDEGSRADQAPPTSLASRPRMCRGQTAGTFSEGNSRPNRAFPDLVDHFQKLRIALIALNLH